MFFNLKNNLEYKIETDNDHKVYTKSDKSEEVIEALKSDLKANKVKILYNTKVVDLIIENNTVIGVKTENNQTILADKVIISTGGKSYPNTGSDGMMYEILKKYGHTIGERSVSYGTHPHGNSPRRVADRPAHGQVQDRDRKSVV